MNNNNFSITTEKKHCAKREREQNLSIKTSSSTSPHQYELRSVSKKTSGRVEAIAVSSHNSLTLFKSFISRHFHQKLFSRTQSIVEETTQKKDQRESFKKYHQVLSESFNKEKESKK